MTGYDDFLKTYFEKIQELFVAPLWLFLQKFGYPNQNVITISSHFKYGLKGKPGFEVQTDIK